MRNSKFQPQKGLAVNVDVSSTGLPKTTGPWQSYTQLFGSFPAPGIWVAQNDIWQVSQTSPTQTWNNSPTSSTNANGDTSNKAPAGYPVPGSPVGCLVCCLGQLNSQGKYVPVQDIQALGVGPNNVKISPIALNANLELLFTINDDLYGAFGPGLGDNGGGLTITVEFNGVSLTPNLMS